MVNVRSIAEMGAYVSLLEYNNIEGMILLSELSRRRIRSINKLIRIGRNECVVVIRVDKEKGYIDLSKEEFLQRKQSNVKINSQNPKLFTAFFVMLLRCWNTPRMSSWKACSRELPGSLMTSTRDQDMVPMMHLSMQSQTHLFWIA